MLGYTNWKWQTFDSLDATCHRTTSQRGVEGYGYIDMLPYANAFTPESGLLSLLRAARGRNARVLEARTRKCGHHLGFLIGGAHNPKGSDVAVKYTGALLGLPYHKFGAPCVYLAKTG